MNTGTIRPGWQNKPNSYGAKAYLAKRIKDSLKVVLDADPMKRTKGQIVIDNLIEVASGTYGPEVSIAAFNALAKAAGLYADAGEIKVLSVTRVTFEPRSDGDLALPETVKTIEQMHQEIARPEGEAVP